MSESNSIEPDESPINVTKKEIESLEKDREELYKKFVDIEKELSYKRKLVESWSMILESETLKKNLILQMKKDNIQ